VSLFQCAKCGCIENTACCHYYVEISSAYYETPVKPPKEDWEKRLFAARVAQFAQWRKVMGLKEGAPFGPYCSFCSPIWYDEKGGYGEGPNPSPAWHGRFEREYLPLGEWEMLPRNGGLIHKGTRKTDYENYLIAAPEGVT
jgi:hypothetical protein